MGTIGILVFPSPGHLNPMASLGRELVSRGHRVVVPLPPDAEPAVRVAGLDFVEVGAKGYPPGSLGAMFARLGQLQGRAAMKYSMAMTTRFALMCVREAPDVFRSLGADLILVDQAVSWAGMVAEHLGIPFVSIANALMFNVELGVPPVFTDWSYTGSRRDRVRNFFGYMEQARVLRPYTRWLPEQRRAWNLPAFRAPNDVFSPFAQISQQPPEFEFPRRDLPPHFHFAGPFQESRARAPVQFPFEALDGRPLVYASLGTLQNRLSWIFRAIAEACADLDVQLVLSLGGAVDPDELGDLAGAPLVVRFAPQLELLSRARLTITHGGLNTVLESLARGVPMVAIPITNDQPGVSARVAWSGAGLVVPPSRLTARRLRDALARVRDDPSFRQNAGRLSQAIRRCGGAARAADIIERVLQTGRPIHADPSR